MKKWLTIGVAFLPTIGLAAVGTPNPDTGGGPNPDTGGTADGLKLTNYLKEPFKKSVPCLIQRILEIIVQIGSLVLVVMIVWTGLKFVMARGNEGELTKAKEAFFWTIIGAAIVLGAFVLSEAVENTVSQLGTLPDGSPASCSSTAN